MGLPPPPLPENGDLGILQVREEVGLGGSVATLSFVCSLCLVCRALCQTLGIQQGTRLSELPPLKQAGKQQTSETWPV